MHNDWMTVEGIFMLFKPCPTQVDHGIVDEVIVDLTTCNAQRIPTLAEIER